MYSLFPLPLPRPRAPLQLSARPPISRPTTNPTHPSLTSDVWAIGVITYFLLCGYTPFDRDSNLEEMQAILAADYSFTPFEYWRNVSPEARKFIQRCLTIDPVLRMTAHQALQHAWITGEPAPDPTTTANTTRRGSARGTADLLPTVKKNFNARRTLHAAIDTIRAINQLRAGGGAAAAASAAAKQAPDPDPMQGVQATSRPHHEEVHDAAGQLPDAHAHAPAARDPRGNARGQTEAQIAEQARRVQETTQGLWQRRG